MVGIPHRGRSRRHIGRGSLHDLPLTGQPEPVRSLVSAGSLPTDFTATTIEPLTINHCRSRSPASTGFVSATLILGDALIGSTKTTVMCADQANNSSLR